MSEITKLNILLAPKYKFMIDALLEAYPDTGGLASRTAKYEFIHGLILLMKYSKQEGISIADAYSRFMNDKEFFLKQNLPLIRTNVAMGLAELANIDGLNKQQVVRESLNKKRGPYKPRRKKIVQEGVVEPREIQEQSSNTAIEVNNSSQPLTQSGAVEDLDDDEELDRLLAKTKTTSVAEDVVEEVIEKPKPKASILDSFKTMKLSD